MPDNSETLGGNWLKDIIALRIFVLYVKNPNGSLPINTSYGSSLRQKSQQKLFKIRESGTTCSTAFN